MKQQAVPTTCPMSRERRSASGWHFCQKARIWTPDRPMVAGFTHVEAAESAE